MSHIRILLLVLLLGSTALIHLGPRAEVRELAAEGIAAIEGLVQTG